MKTKRILTALIGFPIVVLLLIFGNNHVINVVFAITAIMAIREFFNAFKKRANPVKWLRLYYCGINSPFIHNSR